MFSICMIGKNVHKCQLWYNCEKEIMMSRFDNFLRPDEMLACRNCKWYGKRSETICKRFVSSPDSWYHKGGRDGWQYFCPNCDRLVDSYWLRMS